MRGKSLLPILVVLVLGGLGLLSSVSTAGFRLYGSTSSGSGSGSPSSFYEIDLATGDTTLIDTIGFRRVGAMATHPLTGVIYAIGERNAGLVPVLITIDPVTGLGSGRRHLQRTQGRRAESGVVRTWFARGRQHHQCPQAPSDARR